MAGCNTSTRLWNCSSELHVRGEFKPADMLQHVNGCTGVLLLFLLGNPHHLVHLVSRSQSVRRNDHHHDLGVLYHLPWNNPAPVVQSRPDYLLQDGSQVDHAVPCCKAPDRGRRKGRGHGVRGPWDGCPSGRFRGGWQYHSSTDCLEEPFFGYFYTGGQEIQV